MVKKRKYVRKKRKTKLTPPVIFSILSVLLLFSVIYLIVFSLTQNNSNSFNKEITSQKYSTIIERGIDVSTWQKDINWRKVKESGIDFAIIRTGYGFSNDVNQIDAYFYKNIENAKKEHLKVGVYHYSHATTIEEAKQEASFVLSIIDGHSLEYPIYYDLEDERLEHLSTDELTAIAQAFLETIEKAGYKGGIYANKYWLSNKLDITKLSTYEIWIAHYTKHNDYPNSYGVWQFSDKGNVDGIKGKVDLNVAYKYYY